MERSGGNDAAPARRIGIVLRGERRDRLLDELAVLGYDPVMLDDSAGDAEAAFEVLVADATAVAADRTLFDRLGQGSNGPVPVLILLGDDDSELLLPDRGVSVLVRSPPGRAELERALGALLESGYARPLETTPDLPYHTMFESHAMANLIVDPARRAILDANEAAAALYGVSRSELRRMRLEDLTVRDEAAVARGVDNVLSNSAVGYQSRHRRADGTQFDVEVFSHRVDTPTGPLVQATVYDISERLALQGKRAELEAQLLQAQKMEAIARLAGGVAHDFNNMLTVILGYADQIGSGLPQGPIKQASDAIIDAATRSATLARQLLAFSRRQPVHPEVLDLNEHIENLRSMLARLIGEDILLDFDPADRPALVLADPGQIEQVVMNLAVNARDAMPNGGILTIGVGHRKVEPGQPDQLEFGPGPYVLLCVADDGEGMTEDVRVQIFDPFFTTKEHGKGTGLGLATVHGIVKQCGGHIRVQSEPGHGTTFEIFLPAAVAMMPAPRPAPVRRRSTGEERVLVVEDEASLRSLITSALLARGFDVVAASNGAEALDLVRARRFHPDLVLTDVVMPQMNGRELVAALSHRIPELKVLFMSGYASRVAADDSLVAVEAPLVQKPFTIGKLVEAVVAALEG